MNAVFVMDLELAVNFVIVKDILLIVQVSVEEILVLMFAVYAVVTEFLKVLVIVMVIQLIVLVCVEEYLN